MLCSVCNTGSLLLAFLNHTAAMQRGLMLTVATEFPLETLHRHPQAVNLLNRCISFRAKSLTKRRSDLPPTHGTSRNQCMCVASILEKQSLSPFLSPSVSLSPLHTQLHANRLSRTTCSLLYASACGHVAVVQTPAWKCQRGQTAEAVGKNNSNLYKILLNHYCMLSHLDSIPAYISKRMDYFSIICHSKKHIEALAPQMHFKNWENHQNLPTCMVLNLKTASDASDSCLNV